MAQRRIFDFKLPDATTGLNDRDRRIREPGVYWGFVVEPGSGGMELSVVTETHPDLPPIDSEADSLGVLVTKDFVTVIENEDRIDAVTGAENVSGNPRIDLVTAFYRYAKTNQPNPELVINFHEGTPDADPVPPFGVLQDEEIVLAEIYVPNNVTSLSGGYGTTGVIIDNTPKTKITPVSLDGLLQPGVYTGLELDTTVNPDEVIVQPGTMIGPAGQTIRTTVPSDPLTVGDPGVGNVRVDAVYLAIRSNPVRDPNTDFDFILVPGTTVSIGGGVEATPPDDGAVETALQSLPTGQRYTIDDATLLGYVRVADGLTITDVMSTEKRALPEELVVSDGFTFPSSAPFVGPRGLRDVFDLIFAATKDTENPLPRRVRIDGVFPVESDLVVPSRVSLIGNRGWAVIDGDTGLGLNVGGKGFVNSGGSTYSVLGTSAVGSYTRYEIEIAGGYQSGKTLAELRFAQDDNVYFSDGATTLAGLFRGYVDPIASPWRFYVDYLTVQIGTLDPATTTLDLALQKQNVDLSSISVAGKLSAAYLGWSNWGEVLAEDIEMGMNNGLQIDVLRAIGTLSDIADTFLGDPEGPQINQLQLRSNGTFGFSNPNAAIQSVLLLNNSAKLILDGSNGFIGTVGGDLDFAATADGNTIAVVYGDITALGGSTDNVVLRHVGTPTDNGAGNQLGSDMLTRKGTGSFAGSGSSTTITFPSVGTAVYEVIITPIDDGNNPPLGNGTLGEIWIVQRAATQFDVYNSGSYTGAFAWRLFVN